MSRGYRLTPGAQANVGEICAFVADENPDAATRIPGAPEHAFGQLAAYPEIDHTREDLTDRPLTFWAVYSYLVVYDSASEPLTIISVLHGSRDSERLLKEQ